MNYHFKNLLTKFRLVPLEFRLVPLEFRFLLIYIIIYQTITYKSGTFSNSRMYIDFGQDSMFFLIVPLQNQHITKYQVITKNESGTL